MRDSGDFVKSFAKGLQIITLFSAEKSQVTLAEAAGRHVRVLRLRAGDSVVLFDGKGRAAQARIESVGAEIVCQAEEPRTDTTPAALAKPSPSRDAIVENPQPTQEPSMDVPARRRALPAKLEYAIVTQVVVAAQVGQAIERGLGDLCIGWWDRALHPG